MKLYNSYIKTRETGDVEDLIFIKNGFSFYALFLNVLYFMYYGMYRLLFIVLFSEIALVKMLGVYNPSIFDVLIIIISTSLVIGVNANYWHSKFLARKGYKFIGSVFGENKEAAKLRFVEGYIEKYDDEAIRRYKFLNKEDRDILKRKLGKKVQKKEASKSKVISKSKATKKTTAKKAK